jgi:hypothetical protein
MSQEGLKVGTPETGGASRLGAQGDGGPAFPCDVDLHQGFRGATLRDYFAAKIAAGEFAAEVEGVNEKYFTLVAERAYKMADAMLAARGAA